MLYKKIHRQYVKEFRKGRKFKTKYTVSEVIGKPYIEEEGYYIGVDLFNLIFMRGPSKGILIYMGIEWLGD